MKIRPKLLLMGACVFLSACATPPPATTPGDDMSWMDSAYPEEFAALADFLRLWKKDGDKVSGATLAVVPSFSPYIAFEIIKSNEENFLEPGKVKYFLTVRIYDHKKQKSEPLGDAVYKTLFLESYSTAISKTEYDLLIDQFRASRFFDLPDKFTPPFDCNDGTTIHFDFNAKGVNRYDARHECDPDSQVILETAEILLDFAEKKIPETKIFTDTVRQVYKPFTR